MITYSIYTDKMKVFGNSFSTTSEMNLKTTYADENLTAEKIFLF